MDSNLTEEEDIEILYHELLKTIPTDYLDMENVRIQFRYCVDIKRFYVLNRVAVIVV